MNPWQASDSSASAEALFGSAARGDTDRLSDRDILIVDDDVAVLKRRSAELAAEGWSVASYTFAKVEALCARRALFIQHIKLEAIFLLDRDGRLSRQLARFKPKRSYAREISDNSKLAGLAAFVPFGPRGALLAADILYVTARNYGVLSLAERGIHRYAFGPIVASLEEEGLIGPGGARALMALRFMKCLYRSGESDAGGSTASTLQNAIAVLPSGQFPNSVQAVPPSEILLAPDPPLTMPTYFQLRDLERRLIALQTITPSCAQNARLRKLARWIENPRAYSGISSRLAPELRSVMRERAAWRDKAA